MSTRAPDTEPADMRKAWPQPKRGRRLMDNHGAQGRVGEGSHEEKGCRLWLLPSYRRT